MKINLFHHNAIIFPLVLLAVTSLKASTDSILENGNSSNNVKENIVKLAQIPAKELPSAPGTEQSITPKPVQSSQSTQSVQLDLLTSFTPPRAPAAVMNQRHFTIPFALTPSQNTGPFSVELLSSNDQGKTWISSGKIECPSSQKEFYFRADRDGEYWFVLRTSFPGGSRKTSPVQSILVKSEKNEGNAQITKVTQATQVSQTKKESSDTKAPTSQPVLNSAAPSLSLPPRTADSALAGTVESREERAKKLLELASTDTSGNAHGKATGSPPGSLSDPQKSSLASAGGSTPSAMSVSPLSSSAKTDRSKETASTGNATGTGKVAQANPVPANTTAEAAEKAEKPANIALPGQIKSISLSKTQFGDPIIMVRWFRPQDFGLPAGMKGTLRVERSNKAEGPWTTIVSDLQKDQEGYWWKATQLDTIPFYLRIVVTDETGKETSDVAKQKFDLANMLQASPQNSQMTASADRAASQSGGNAVGAEGNSQAIAAVGSGESKAKEADHVAKTGAKTTEKKFLSRLFKKGEKQEPRDVPPTPQESLARSNMKDSASGKKEQGSVTGVQAATYSSASSAPTVNEPSPVFQLPNANHDNKGPWKEAGLEREIDTQTQNLQNEQNTQLAQNRASQGTAPTAPYTQGVRTAKSYQPPQRNYDPGVLNWNPLFTEGFGALFAGRQPQADRVEMQNVQGGNVETPAAPKKRSIFTPPERYNALPKQEETGYNGASGAYSDGTGTMNQDAMNQGMVNQDMMNQGMMNQGVMNQGTGVVSDPSGMSSGGMIAAGAGMSGESGVISGGSVQGGMMTPQGGMAGPPSGVNSSEIIYLDQHGNRIANPFASGAMNSWGGNGAMPGNVSGMSGGPVEGGQYMMDPAGNLVPYSPSAMSGMSGASMQAESPFSTSGSGTFVPGANSSNTGGMSNGAVPSGTGGTGATGMTMPGPR